MLKSLFESSIDKLHIPADMKDAIKQINNICLEAEGDDKENDLGYTPVPKEDIENAKKQMVNEKYKYEAYPKAEQSNAAPKNDGNDEKSKKEENTDVNNAKPEQASTQNTEQQQTQAATSGEQPAQNSETKTAEQPAQNTDAQPSQNAEGQQAQAADGKAAKQPAAQPAKPQYRRGADVATVQYFLQSVLPNSNIVADGILGPKTITAIQQKEDIDTTGKMDENTQNAFNQLLAEAKKKVIPLQEKLGVTADGLIGKQTLQAMAKQNMHVANVFSKDVKNANTPAANTNVATKKADVNLLDTPFDAAKAEKSLASKEITKAEYNTWKEFGISPEHQRNNPKETKAECIRLAHYPPAERQQVIQERLAKNDPKTGAQSKQAQPTGADKFKPQNEEEQKFYDKTVQNYINVYKKMGSDDQAAAKQAERVAQNHLVKYRNGTLPKAQMPKDVKPAVGVGNDNNVAEVAANVKGPKDDAEKKFFNQTKANWTKVYAEKFKNDPSRVEPAAEQQARIELMKYRARMAQAARKNGQQQQEIATKGNAKPTPQQKVAPQGNTNPSAKSGTKQNPNTEYLEGTVSYINLPADEKRVYDAAYKKAQEGYLNAKKDEQTAMDMAATDANVAVLRYRKKRGRPMNG